MADPPIDFIGRQLNAPRGPKAKPSRFEDVLETDEAIVSRTRPRFGPYLAGCARHGIGAVIGVVMLFLGFWPMTLGLVLMLFSLFGMVTHLAAFRGTEYLLTELRLLARVRDPQFAWHHMVEVVRLRRLVSVEAGRTTVTVRHRDADGDVHTVVLLGVPDPQDLAKRLKAPSTLPITDGSYRDG